MICVPDHLPVRIRALVAPDGTRYGEPIPGSRFFRSFCPRCQTPMRVTRWRARNGIDTFCSDCEPSPAACAVGNANTRLNGVDADPDAYARATG